MTAYARLRRAVLAYAEALKRYGAFGSTWVGHAEDLDELWDAVLQATTPDETTD
jgi:predicted phosphohydrolase